jgi:hypothetical protein
MVDDEKPERAACVAMSLAQARQCRDSCREWAPTRLADNKCVACFQALIACGASQEADDSPGNDRSYAVDSKACLAASAACTANCRSLTSPVSGTPAAASERPN